MVEITNKKKCCGCTACAEICPKHCIEMKEDNEGFLYPFVDVEKCVNCGLCNKACPELNVGRKIKPLKVWAAYSIDEEIRKNSSSGGIFFTVASHIIHKGGVVFGARYNEQWGVEFGKAETVEDLKPLMVSKYVQSNVGSAYIECKQLLKEGRPVFFTGTSCQIAGLRCFLGKEYDSLLTAEVVCHGVPSPRVWHMYLDEIRNEVKGVGVEKGIIETISFRKKNPSWDRFNFNVSFKGENASKKESGIDVYHMENIYMKGFVYNLILRPSCYECPFKSGRSGADLTIADYWGVKKFHPDFYDDKGTSIVMANTNKGKGVVDELKLRKVESSYSKVRYSNPAIVKPHKPHVKRDVFFNSFRDKDSISDWIDECLIIPNWLKQKQHIDSIIDLIIRKLKYGIL